MVKRPTKDMSRFLKLVCDGKDLTELVRRKKIHVLLFVNISSWGVGDLASPPFRTALCELVLLPFPTAVRAYQLTYGWLPAPISTYRHQSAVAIRQHHQ
jgi:hypothetical protein